MQIYSADGVVVKTNPACEEFWGVAAEDSVNRYNIFQDKQARAIGLTSAFNQALLGTGSRLRDVEYDPALAGSPGQKRFLHVRMLPLEPLDGQVEGVVCIMEDNTERRLAEQKQYSDQERLEQEVAVRTRHLEALLQFSAELSALDELEAVYQFVTSWVKNLLNFDYSSLFILSSDTGRLTMEGTVGFSRSMVGSFSLRQDQGLPGLVAREQQLAVVEDFQTEKRFKVPEVILEHKLTSALAVPMVHKNELIGVLTGYNRATRIFTESDISLYQNIANQAAVAIANTTNLRSLKRSEERFRHLFENANDAIYLVDGRSRRIVDCNRKALTLDGYRRSEITTMKMCERYPVEEREMLNQRFDQVLRQGACSTVASLHHLQKDSKRIPVEISASLVETGGQQLIMNIVRDVSRRKALEKEREATSAKLRRSCRMEAIGLMAGGVAHDLNNILSGVISFPELMMMNFEVGSPVRADLRKIMESGQRAASVVTDLLTVARGAATVKEAACLNELIRDYTHSAEFCQLKSLYPRVDFIHRLDADVKNISCSPVHVQKLLMNLATNAAEAIDGSGRVEIKTWPLQLAHEDVEHGVPAGEYTCFSVRDSGAGISRHDLDHIFDPFYTTKKMGRSGTGLGLAVVWNTVQDHEGFIAVDSDEQGTLFTLYLPVSSKAVTCRMSRHESSLVGLSGQGTILVVDDEWVQREVVGKILTTLGYEVTAVNSGEDAIAFLESNRVDLVLLDMLMEPGINGRETFEEIIRLHPGQRAIVVSGYAESDDIKKIMELGGRGLLKKPYTMAEIGRAVQKALGERKRGSAATGR